MTQALLTREPVVVNNAVQWDLMRNQLDQVNSLAMRDLVSIVRRAQEMNPWEGRQYLTEAFEALVNTYGGVAADLTVDWWNEIMADDIYFIQPADMPSLEQLTVEVAWGTARDANGHDDVMSRMALLTQKHIFGAHRNTVDLNSLNTKVGYARVASPDACAFCRMLASRGAVYGSESAAMYVGAASVVNHYSDGKQRGTRLKKGRVRGVQKAGSKYHDHCRCIVAPISKSRDLNLPEHANKYLEEYQAAVAALDKENPGAVHSMADVTRMMRQQGNGK
ncbi:VG15 protein [Corynebacterium sp. ZY180755]